MMRKISQLGLIAALCLFLLSGCSADSDSPTANTQSFAEARTNFKPKLVFHDRDANPPDNPAPSRGSIKLIQYDAKPGKLWAYLSGPTSAVTGKRPAIVWITGGDCNSIGDVWTAAPKSNDQTAKVFRDKGIVTMYPSLRGGNGNPGAKEYFFGEIDDVLAAADYLAKLPHVDKNRIYLGGHSTGGTMVILVSETSDRFRATFAFGPVEDVSGYGDEYVKINRGDKEEVKIRSPIHWLSSVKKPLFVFEGGSGNISSLRALQKASRNEKIIFTEVTDADHFSILQPLSIEIADKILKDTGSTCNIKFD
jgi:alpha/beta superfamily hydrolase